MSSRHAGGPIWCQPGMGVWLYQASHHDEGSKMNETGYQIAVRYAEALTKRFEGTPFAPTYTGRQGPRLPPDRHERFRALLPRLRGRFGQPHQVGGWKRPQKDKDGLAIRFRLSTEPEFAATVAVADRYGSYLYVSADRGKHPVWCQPGTGDGPTKKAITTEGTT